MSDKQNPPVGDVASYEAGIRAALAECAAVVRQLGWDAGGANDCVERIEGLLKKKGSAGMLADKRAKGRCCEHEHASDCSYRRRGYACTC